jgi:vacuolar-type H+-ATPase subunit F/Vma7
MIVLGNPEFATGMRLAGLKESYSVRKREDVLELLKTLNQKEFIIANVSVFKMLPELEEFVNVVTIPDDVEKFGNTDDLKSIIKSAVGIELNI